MGKIIDEATKNQIVEFREKGLTIKQISLALEIGESTVKKYSSSNPDKENKIDEKTGKALGKIMEIEGYDFQDEINPLVYKLKDQANELDITLYDYLNDLSNILNKFLRLTDTPERLYYIFMLISSQLSLITDHINAEDLINAVNNFYDREMEMEEAEEFIVEIEEKADLLLTNSQEIWNKTKKNIENIKKEATKEIEEKSQTLLKNSKEEYTEYQEKIKNAHEELTKVILNRLLINDKGKTQEKENQELKKLLNESDNKKSLLEEAFKRIGSLFPEESKIIIQEIEKELQMVENELQH